MRSAPFDQPKTRYMKTLHENDSIDYCSKKRLFKQLFLLQIELGDYSAKWSDDRKEVQEIIRTIDVLLESWIE